MSNRAVVYKTWSNFESKACRELYELGIDAEAPRDESGKRVRVTAPGYVFAAREVHHAFLRHVRHKVGIVNASDVANLRVAKLPEPEIKPRAFAPGDRVQINVGPFATMEGIVERDRNRVYMVAIDGLNVSAVSVHPSHMIRIDPG